MINELLCDVLQIRVFLKSRTYSASVENSLFPEKNSEGREINVRTAGVDPGLSQRQIDYPGGRDSSGVDGWAP